MGESSDTTSYWTTETYELEQDVFAVTEAERFFLLLYLTCTSVATVFLNASVLFVILREDSLRRNPMSWILCCQVVCDLLTPFVYVPIAIVFIQSLQGMLSSTVAEIQGSLYNGITNLLPIHFLTLLTIERYVYICKPLKHPIYFCPRQVGKYISGIILLTLGTDLVCVQTFTMMPDPVELSFVYQLNSDNDIYVFMCIPLLFGILPALVQGYCFVSIMYTVIQQGRRINSETSRAMPGMTGASSSTHLPRDNDGTIRDNHGTLRAMSGMTEAKLPHLSTRHTILKAVLGVARLCGIYWITWFPATIIVSVLATGDEEGSAFKRASFQLIRRYSMIVIITIVPIFNPLVCIRSVAGVRGKWLQAFGNKSRQTG